MAGTSMAFEAEVWSTLENNLFDESGGSARIAGVVLNIAIISHSRQWVIVCFRGETGHDDCTAECLLLTQSGHPSPLDWACDAAYCHDPLKAAESYVSGIGVANRDHYSNQSRTPPSGATTKFSDESALPMKINGTLVFTDGAYL
jgi:hypothetical protein